jgi:hypothetical protein
VDYSVFTKGAPVAMIEQQLAPLANMSRLLGHVAPTCVDAYYRYSCSLAYPKCGENGSGKAQRTYYKQSCTEYLMKARNIPTQNQKWDVNLPARM